MLGLISGLTAAKVGSTILTGIMGINTVVNIESFIKDIIDD